MSYNDYEPVIGLEIHAQLKTNSKIFSSDRAAFGGHDNENVSLVSVGLPGVLPVLNKKVIDYSILSGLALNCRINQVNVFSRKNYFYPDLPKGYQISQFDLPICGEGYVEFDCQGERKKVRIERAHMEEDAGKSTHHGEYTLVNYNRAGVALLEIVSAPEMHSPEEAAEYARTVKSILAYVETCDGNLEQGSLRCDCNVSVRKKGVTKLGDRVEIKNINSFRFIEKAIEFEIHRQIDSLERGVAIAQETRLYDAAKGKTFTMRKKEDAQDYRYFPDPDLLPVTISHEHIEKIRSLLPELPGAKQLRFQEEFKLSVKDAHFLSRERELAQYFEEVQQGCGNAKSAVSWVTGELLARLNDENLSISQSKVSAQKLAELIAAIDAGSISGKTAKHVFQTMWNGTKTASEIIADEGLVQVKDSGAIEGWVEQMMAENPEQVAEFRAGKNKVMGFFVGQIMKKSKGQADPVLVNQILKAKLK